MRGRSVSPHCYGSFSVIETKNAGVMDDPEDPPRRLTLYLASRFGLPSNESSDKRISLVLLGSVNTSTRSAGIVLVVEGITTAIRFGVADLRMIDRLPTWH